MKHVDLAFITADFMFNGIVAVVSKLDVNNPEKVLGGSWMDEQVQRNAFIQLRDSNKFTISELLDIRRLDRYDFYQCIK